MANFTALFDANVLYPAPVRDLLMWLATTDLFRARWTDEIHEEWIRNLLENRSDLTREQLERTRRMMDEHVDDCLITGYEALIDALVLPDLDDRHVLAAAIVGRADVIVTKNLADFPEAALAPFGIEAQHPDEFITHIIDLAPARVCTAVRACHQNLKNPPKTVDEYLDTLLRQEMPHAVAAIRNRCFAAEG
ncbi:MAG: PIN domain-containing protein [Acidobacteria bacterium]|nr:PIN domain-containing protein [Acidobacteriota bacterium]